MKEFGSVCSVCSFISATTNNRGSDRGTEEQRFPIHTTPLATLWIGGKGRVPRRNGVQKGKGNEGVGAVEDCIGGNGLGDGVEWTSEECTKKNCRATQSKERVSVVWKGRRIETKPPSVEAFASICERRFRSRVVCVYEGDVEETGAGQQFSLERGRTQPYCAKRDLLGRPYVFTRRHGVCEYGRFDSVSSACYRYDSEDYGDSLSALSWARNFHQCFMTGVWAL